MATLKANRIISDEQHSVIVVESVESHHEIGDDFFGFFAWSEPVAVVTSNANGAQAVDINGEPLDLDCLIRDADELNVLLER